MNTESRKPGQDLPFSVAPYRFDQKNEMFKRALWDEKMRPHAMRFYKEVKFKEKIGYRKIDYAFRNAAWNIEWSAAFGNARSNSGLYEWEGINERIKQYVESGEPVKMPPEKMGSYIKKAARYFGADLVGICRVHPNWIYSHEYNALSRKHYPAELPKGINNAVVLAVAMDYQGIQLSPTTLEGGITGFGYSMMAVVANLLATFIRGLGYRAIPCGNDTALSVPLAMAAGLGETGRLGILITEKFGPRVRLCKIFTDLPLSCDTYRPFGVKAFCEECKKCATYCPGQAITDSEMTEEGHNISNQSGTLKWYVNAEKCFAFWAKNRSDCANCIRVCPFNKPQGIIHDMTRGIIRRTTLFNRFLLWMDDFFGYEKPIHPEKFWN
ncbi:MAG TPA: reductive dehalogenase [Desulfobacterales bacterium]|nr:reductive dehalogenase [Desulfobacterales bacterium]